MPKADTVELTSISTGRSSESVSGERFSVLLGDALGTTVEFKRPGSFALLTDIVGGEPFNLKAGQWTDDTSMALCLAESLIERGRLDSVDQHRGYIRLWRDGHHSSNGTCFDIGNQTSAALQAFKQSGKPWMEPGVVYLYCRGGCGRTGSCWGACSWRTISSRMPPCQRSGK